MKDKQIIGMRYGALSDPIEDQLRSQGLTLGDKAVQYQDDVDACIRLFVRGHLTDSAHNRVLDKIHKSIMKNIKRIEVHDEQE